jgi:hypothetical protein
LDAAGLDANIAGWRLIGTLLGVGAGTTPGCTLFFCNGSNLVVAAASLGVDAVQQLLAAVAATTADFTQSLLAL